MKKKTKIVIVLFCVILICLFVVNNVINREKKISIAQVIQIDKGELNINVKSIKKFDTLEECTDYNEMYLYVDDKVDVSPDIYSYEIIDWERLYEENPQYVDYEEHPEKYSIDKAIKVKNEIAKIESNYMYQEQIKCDFVFLECNIKNVDSKALYYGMNDQLLIKCDGDEWEEYLPIYFTNSETNNSDPEFFIKNIRKNEEFSYVLGYAIPENELDGDWYWGDPDVMVDPKTEEQLNPIMQDMYVKKIELK